MKWTGYVDHLNRLISKMFEMFSRIGNGTLDDHVAGNGEMAYPDSREGIFRPNGGRGWMKKVKRVLRPRQGTVN